MMQIALPKDGPNPTPAIGPAACQVVAEWLTDALVTVRERFLELDQGRPPRRARTLNAMDSAAFLIARRAELDQLAGVFERLIGTDFPCALTEAAAGPTASPLRQVAAQLVELAHAACEWERSLTGLELHLTFAQPHQRLRWSTELWLRELESLPARIVSPEAARPAAEPPAVTSPRAWATEFLAPRVHRRQRRTGIVTAPSLAHLAPPSRQP
jgi:hypothetical protein